MIENILTGWELFFQLQVFLFIVLGVFIGIIIGALPGMTVVMAITLALPFTFYLPPVVSLAFLIGIYKAGVYGGSISAILIGTPGTPGASATIIDGYPMSKKGLAKKALDIALYSSVISDALSDIVTIFATVQIAYLAVKIGPVEYFAIILFSLTIIASVSGKSIIKGLISGALGLLLATIGMETIYGIPRFTFGNINLTGGLNIIPVLIGLFAVPEMISQLQERKLHPKQATIIQMQKMHDPQLNKITWREFKETLKTIIRGSIIGTFIGIIPGVGAAPASFISYNRAKKASRHPEEFGNGSLEGVAAAESGNNGVCGPTLIPLLTLGIPGDKTTAVLLGALMIQGLTPGPILFQKHINIIYGIFIAMLLTNIVVFFVGKLFISRATLVLHVPKEILFSIVFVLCMFGSYAFNNNLFDVWVMVVIGALGYLMMRFELPQAPFVIAFILSTMFERGLRRSLIMSKGDFSVFLTHPISLIFILLTIATIFFGFWRRKKKIITTEEE